MHTSPDLLNSSVPNPRPVRRFSGEKCQVPKGDGSLGLKPPSSALGACFTGCTVVLRSPLRNQCQHALNGHKSVIASPFRKGDGFAWLITEITSSGAVHIGLLTIFPSPVRRFLQARIICRCGFPKGMEWSYENVCIPLGQLVMAFYGSVFHPPFEKGTDIGDRNVA